MTTMAMANPWVEPDTLIFMLWRVLILIGIEIEHMPIALSEKDESYSVIEH